MRALAGRRMRGLLLVLILAQLGLPQSNALMQYQRLVSTTSITSASMNSDVLRMRLNPSSFKGSSYTITEFPRPALRKVPNADVADFEDDALQSRAKDMMSIMYDCKGVGLAAPQIGLNDNLFVYNPSGDPEVTNMERIVCNPVIVEFSKEIEVEEEGCLSLQSDYVPGNVARSAWIEVEYQNELGQKTKRRLKGFEARVFQHEYDHLKGILCWDRFPPEDREAVQANIDALLGVYKEDDAMVDPDTSVVFQPPVLSARQMPPLDDGEVVVKKKKAAPAKSGFGGGKKKTNTKKKRKR